MAHSIDKNFFPGWVRKSMTFTIDDGNLKLDRKFLDVVKPMGFRGTFNLCANREVNDVFPALYDGYEIANHCYLHPHAFNDERRALLTDAPFDPDTADKTLIYRDPKRGPGYYLKAQPYGWTVLADDDTYIRLAEQAEENLVSIFGRDRVKGFIYPYGYQKNEALQKRLEAMGFASIRWTGCVKDSTGFALPADRMRWSYNANDGCLTETAEQYDAYPDDGQLKFFCFGVHSHDFENHGTWDVLIDFVNRMGNRPENFWYACVGEIFEYEDAVARLDVTDGALVNPTEKDLYVKVDGRRLIVHRRSSVSL